MKKILLLFTIAMSGYCSYAQNTFPSSGNVGIGTVSPIQLLDVTGFSGSFNTTAKANAGFFQDHTNYRGVLLGYDSSGQTGIISSASQSSVSNLAFWGFNGSNYFEAMRLSGAKIGIGITNPIQLLQVNGNISAAAAADAANTYFTFQRSSDSYTGAQIGNVYEFSGYRGSLVFETNNGNSSTSLSEAMRINSFGNVLIGKTGQSNSSYKLDINGSARANAIVVNTTGADFVFEHKYPLKKLTEVKSFIDKNHHLPEIQSAKEMQTNGVDLGELNTKLLQKVEELTLYAIEQQKQIDEIRKKDEARITALEQALLKLTSNHSK